MISIVICPYPQIAYYKYKAERPNWKIVYIGEMNIPINISYSRSLKLAYKVFLARKENKNYLFIKRLNRRKNWEGNIKEVDKRIRELADEIIFFSGVKY